MKILFFNMKPFEYDYLLERIPKELEPYFFNIHLDNQTYIDEKYIDAQALSVFVNSQLDKEVLSKFKKLKYIFLRCTGYSNVDLKYCAENNIQVFNTPNYGNSTVAEYVFALLLTLCKKINNSKEQILNGIIDSSSLVGIELFNKTIGIIGAGAIGRKVINIAHGFNMNVLVYDVEPKGAYNFVELEYLLKNSDVISINCPLNSSTRYLINREAFNIMKKNAILINTARGEIINTKDLYRALAENRIKGAALDVIECEQMLCENYKKCTMDYNFSEECLKKFFFIQKLTQMNNVIITPHNAYNTIEAQKRILDITLLNIKSTFDVSSSLKNLVLL